MKLLQPWSEDHRETPVDMFVDEPFIFDEEYGAALKKTCSENSLFPWFPFPGSLT